MSFEQLVFGFELDPNLLGGEPAFRVFGIQDRNPLSKRTKKRRRLEAPNEPMRIIHRRLIQYLRSLNFPMPHATACRPGDSPLKNVQHHRHHRFFYLIDLHNAYQNVRVAKLAGVVRIVDAQLKGSFWEIRRFLSQYCMSRFGGLAAGAPASPDLFNMYCAVLLDRPLARVCGRYGLTYTRYLDDLTFSANHTISRRATNAICRIVREARFQPHDYKTQRHDLVAETLIINGIGLELGGRIFVPPFYIQYIRGLLNLGLQGDLSLLPEIQGAMSVFFGVVNRHKPTAIEGKVLRDYQRFRRLFVQTRQQRKAPALN